MRSIQWFVLGVSWLAMSACSGTSDEQSNPSGGGLGAVANGGDNAGAGSAGTNSNGMSMDGSSTGGSGMAGSAGQTTSADEPERLSGITAAHNAERAATGDGLPPLTWDPDLARVAQAWSDTLASQGCDLMHSNTQDYGENLFWTSTTATPQEVVQSWVSEKADYTFGPFGDPGTCSGVCGHYTQIVWRDTQRLGCAVADCSGRGGEVWTCNYDPPGNYLGEEPY